MFFGLALVLFLLPLSICFVIQDLSTPGINCEKLYYDYNEIIITCKNISITSDKQFKFSYINLEIGSKIEITNSNVPRLYKNTFISNEFLAELIIYESGLTKIYSDDFSELLEINKLNFTNNVISEVEENAFSKNQQLTQLILKKNKLNSIKNLTSYSQLTQLDVSYNLITKIKENDVSKNLSDKLLINLSNNLISEIEKNAFSTDIYKIDLSYNRLHKLPSNFDSIKINGLYISHNKLTEIHCKNIVKDLDVGHNYLDTICDLANTLVHLKYRSNNVQYISEIAFNGSSQLEYLDLSSNEISSINTMSFRNLGQLRILNLSSNALQGLGIISGLHFQNLVKLHTLDLSRNNLNKLLYGTFSGVDFLRFLDISYNDLTSIDSLLSLIDLHVLNISSNPLEKIQPHRIVSHLPTLKKIVLDFDELACDELITYLSVFNEHRVQVEVGPAIYNSNIHGHHCDPDKLYYIDPIIPNYKKMIYLTDYISQFNVLVLVILIGLLLLIAGKLFDIYKIAQDTRRSETIGKPLSDMEANNDA